MPPPLLPHSHPRGPDCFVYLRSGRFPYLSIGELPRASPLPRAREAPAIHRESCHHHMTTLTSCRPREQLASDWPRDVMLLTCVICEASSSTEADNEANQGLNDCVNECGIAFDSAQHDMGGERISTHSDRITNIKGK